MAIWYKHQCKQILRSLFFFSKCFFTPFFIFQFAGYTSALSYLTTTLFADRSYFRKWFIIWMKYETFNSHWVIKGQEMCQLNRFFVRKLIITSRWNVMKIYNKQNNSLVPSSTDSFTFYICNFGAFIAECEIWALRIVVSDLCLLISVSFGSWGKLSHWKSYRIFFFITNSGT